MFLCQNSENSVGHSPVSAQDPSAQQKVESFGQFPRVPSVVPFPVPGWPSTKQLSQIPASVLQTGPNLSALPPVMHVCSIFPLGKTLIWH